MKIICNKLDQLPDRTVLSRLIKDVLKASGGQFPKYTPVFESPICQSGDIRVMLGNQADNHMLEKQVKVLEWDQQNIEDEE